MQTGVANGKHYCRYGKLSPWMRTSIRHWPRSDPGCGHCASRRRPRWPTSASTGISVSTLSRLESGDRRPTLELLLPLAKAYGVTLDELVDAPPTGDPRIHLRPVTGNGMTMVPLTRRAGGIQAYKI